MDAKACISASTCMLWILIGSVALPSASAASLTIYNHVKNSQGVQQILKATCSPTGPGNDKQKALFLDYGEKFYEAFDAQLGRSLSCTFQYDKDGECQTFVVWDESLCGTDCAWDVMVDGFSLATPPLNEYAHLHDWSKCSSTY